MTGKPNPRRDSASDPANEKARASMALIRVPETDAQGPHRLARGHFFYSRSAHVARHMGAAFDWRVMEVPGAGHRNDEMAPAAARLMAAGY